MNFLTRDMHISRKKFLAVVLIFSSSFAWFFVFYNYYSDLFPFVDFDENVWYDFGILFFLIFTVISAFIGSTLSEKINRRKFLLIWIIIGILAILPSPFFTQIEYSCIVGILAGLSFGLGFPACQAFIADSTEPEERGRVAGIVILSSFILVVLSILAIEVLYLDSIGILIISIGIKSIGFLSFIFDPIDRKRGEPKKWLSILKSKDFNYYLLVFILFSVAAGLVSLIWNQLWNLDDEYIAANRLGSILRQIGLSIFAVIAGFMADKIGRKKPIILGLIMLGAAYAVVGLLTTPETYFANLILSGLAWGVIWVVYLVVPGDLSTPGSHERYYAIGWLLPITLFIGIEATGRLTDFAPPIGIFSTILTVIILAAILPILSAVETLSESKIRSRKFRDYTEKVGKLIQESKE